MMHLVLLTTLKSTFAHINEMILYPLSDSYYVTTQHVYVSIATSGGGGVKGGGGGACIFW